MKRLLFKGASLLLFLLAAAQSCPAVLGEDEHQLEQRYGKFIPELTNHFGPLVTRGYLVRGTIMTMVMIHRGKSVCEVYTRADKQPLPDHLISAMLEGNAHRKKWQAVPPEKGVDRQWSLAKKAAEAAYQATGDHPMMIVYASGWLPYAREQFQKK